MGLSLGHSRTFTFLFWSHSSVALAVCLGSLSRWNVTLCSQSKVVCALKQVLITDFPVFGSIHCSLYPYQSLPLKSIPIAWHCHHHQLHSRECVKTGDELCLFYSRHWFTFTPKSYIIRLIRPQDILPYALSFTLLFANTRCAVIYLFLRSGFRLTTLP